MKKIIIWFLSATILAVVIAAGFFYYQSNPNIFNNITTNNKEATNPTLTQTQNLNYEAIPIDKLPPDVQLKDIITEYPLKIGTTNDKAILRITNKDVIYKNQVNNMPSFEKIEILINGISIYQDKSNQFALFYNKNSDSYTLSSDTFFSTYKIIKGTTKDYIAYFIDEPHAEGTPDYYIIASIDTNNLKSNAIKLDGSILLSSSHDFANPKIDNNTYKLIDNKYIISRFFNHFFDVIAYYEIDNNAVKFSDREFEIINVEEDNQTPDKNKMKEVGSIILYSKPDINSASKSVKLSEKTQIKLLGIKYITPRDMDSMTHIKIDNEEGWIDYGSLLNNLGFNFYG